MLETSNKRIAKNTLLLYARMILLLSISLYTSRVVLATLGVSDYGVYNVVGGIVLILCFLNNSMAGATQRFLNIELGKKSEDGVVKVFRTAQYIHLIIAVIVFLLAETIGIWFLNTYMNIPSERMIAANYVFQFSICSFLVSIISVPYNATIIAHERMSAFAYISILEAVLKLAIVFLLMVVSFDKLIFYAALMAIVQIIVRFSYSGYCRRHFIECKKYSLKYDKDLLHQMMGFSGWTIFGALGSISHTQGISIIINIFFGAAVNAAQSIANQVNMVVNQFVTNFMISLNPQIVKNYAAHDLEQMHSLVKRGSKMGFFLVAFFVVPLFLEAPTLLDIWLVEVPNYTVIFIRIIILTTLCNSFASPLATAQAATGKIRTYQIILTSLGWMHLPLAWAFFALGFPPYYAMYIYFCLIIIMQSYRIWKVSKSIQMTHFIKDVLLPCVLVFILSITIPAVLHVYFNINLWTSILNCCIGGTMVILTSYYIGLTATERQKVKSLVKSKVHCK